MSFGVYGFKNSPQPAVAPYDLTNGGSDALPSIVDDIQWPTPPQVEAGASEVDVTAGNFASLESAGQGTAKRIVNVPTGTYSNAGDWQITSNDLRWNFETGVTIDLQGNRMSIGGGRHEFNFNGALLDSTRFDRIAGGQDVLLDEFQQALDVSGLQNDISPMTRWAFLNSTIELSNNSIWGGVHTDTAGWHHHLIFANMLVRGLTGGNELMRWQQIYKLVVMDSLFEHYPDFSNCFRAARVRYAYFLDSHFVGSQSLQQEYADAVVKRCHRWNDAAQGGMWGSPFSDALRVTVNDSPVHTATGPFGGEASLGNATGTGNTITEYDETDTDTGYPDRTTYGQGTI